MKLQVKIISEGQSNSRSILVDGSMKVVDFVKEHEVYGPFHNSNGREQKYSIVGNEETFAAMMSGLSKERSKFEDSVYFKELPSEELVGRSRKEALSKFEADRESETAQLMERIENLKKVRDEVGKFTSPDEAEIKTVQLVAYARTNSLKKVEDEVQKLSSLDDKFLKYFDHVKKQNSLQLSEFAGVRSKKEAIDAIKNLEDTLEERVKLASDHKLEIDFSLENKCLSLLNSCDPVDIKFKEIDQPNFSYYSGSTTRTFYSKEHWKENNQSKLFKKNRLVVGVEGSGAGFGSLGTTKGEASYGYKNYRSEEIDLVQEGGSEATQVVVSKQSINQLVKFQARCASLKSDAEDRARQVARESENGNAEILRDFFKEYPEEINCGPFGVGGRFEIIAVTTSSEKMSVSHLQTIASKQVNHDFKLALSLGLLTDGGGIQKEMVEVDDQGSGTGSSKIELNTQIEKYCFGPNVTRDDDLNSVLRIDPQSWNIFPSPDGSEHRFVPIYKVIKDMAKLKGGDEELSKAARIMKKYLKEQKQGEAKQKVKEEAKRNKEEEARRRGKRFMFCEVNDACFVLASVWSNFGAN